MERLTKRRENGKVGFNGNGTPIENTMMLPKIMERLADYEDTEEQGKLIRLPCKAGDVIWVIEREEDGEAYDVAGYMFISLAANYSIVTSFINDIESIEETMEYHKDYTLQNYNCDLCVFPIDDCYVDKKEAEEALRKERT